MSATDIPPATRPERDDVEKQLRQILASASFASSPRLSSFLSFIVGKSLAGEADQLKGYTIGVEIYGKPPDFNPESDSTVRVEAIRLRKTLTHYYQTEGQNDPVLITVAKGNYRPVFTFQRQPDIAAEIPPPAAAQPPQEQALTAPLQVTHTANYVITTLAVTLFLAALGFLLLDATNPYEDSDASLQAARQEQDGILPVVTVFPFYLDDRASDTALMMAINGQIISKLNLFHTIKVATSDILQKTKYWETRSIDYAQSMNADYVIEGNLRRDNGALRATVRLLDRETKNYVWSREETIEWHPEHEKQAIDELSTLIVSQIASPYGALESAHKAKLERQTSVMAQNVRCVLDYQAYSNRKNPLDHKKVRECLEQAVKRNPAFSDGWAALSWVYGDEVRMGYNLQGTNAQAKQRAFEAAKASVAADQRNPRAHQYMALAAQMLNQSEVVRQHNDMALALNPYDSEVVADAAWVYCQLGEWDRCYQLGTKAIKINPLHPDWYYFSLFIYHYQKADYRNALDYALRYRQPDFLWSNLLVLATYGKLGQQAEAEKVAAHIKTTFPEYTRNPAAVFRPWGLQPAVVEKLMDGIRMTSLGTDIEKR